MLTITCALPRSRGSQRQRSMLMMTVSIASLRRHDAVERAPRVGTKPAVGSPAFAPLEAFHRLDEIIVIAQARFVAGDVEPLAQERHAWIFGPRAHHRAVRNVHGFLFLRS